MLLYWGKYMGSKNQAAAQGYPWYMNLNLFIVSGLETAALSGSQYCFVEKNIEFASRQVRSYLRKGEQALLHEDFIYQGSMVI